MKFIVSLAASAVLGAAAAAPSLQDSQERGARPLTPVGEVEDTAGEAKAPVRPFLEGAGRSPADAPAGGLELEEGIRQRLTGRDLELRMESFQEVAERAALSADVRRALESIARDTADLDLAFSARLALREADRVGPRGRAGRAFGGQGSQAPADPFEAMRRQLDSVFGADPFLDSALRNDPFLRRGFGGSRGLSGAAPVPGEDPFEAMRSRVERMREEMEALQRGGVQRTAPGSWAARSSSTSIERTADGVRVVITEDDGDGPETRVFEGSSLEDLLRDHPELEGRIR
ncbi:MAG: hypothetical protein VX460_12420 [Planctomycetota bacterium]|nr:hypothetical protein [Planctomycetota bacterium]